MVDSVSSNVLGKVSENAVLREGLNLLFDEQFYLSTYPDVAQSHQIPLEHYLQFGAKEKRDPHPLFSTVYYLRQCPELELSGQNPLLHYIVEGAFNCKDPCPVFHASWYRKRYHEHLKNDANPLLHFLQFGAQSGCDPNPYFHTASYVRKHLRGAEAKMNPLIHYLRYGASRGYNPSPAFDAGFYTRRYPDVLETGFNPLWHYLEFGHKETRQCRPVRGKFDFFRDLSDWTSMIIHLPGLARVHPLDWVKMLRILSIRYPDSLPAPPANVPVRARDLIITFAFDTFNQPIDSLLEAVGRDQIQFRGFNSQFVRASILLYLIRELCFDEFWETGTHIGDTSLLVAAQAKVRIASCELNQDYFKLADETLKPFGKRVELFNEDSRVFLRRLVARRSAERPFVYLDAHWYEELPLLQEIEIIINSNVEFLIVIDDFEVRADSGFGYDEYAESKLSLDYIHESVDRPGIAAFQPAYASSVESGCKRGYILLASAQIAKEINSVIPASLLSQVK